MNLLWAVSCLLGAVLAGGVLLVLAPKSLRQPPASTSIVRQRTFSAPSSLGAAAGIPWLSRRIQIGIATLCFAVAFLLVAGVSQSEVLGAIFAVISATLPSIYLRSRSATRRKQLREVWPDVIDQLASAVRAGMAIPEALIQVGVSGPEGLRPSLPDKPGLESRAHR